MILFCDDELFNIELESRSIRSAVREAKDRFRIIGRVRRTGHYGNIFEYKLVGSDYGFTLRQIN